MAQTHAPLVHLDIRTLQLETTMQRGILLRRDSDRLVDPYLSLCAHNRLCWMWAHFLTFLIDVLEDLMPLGARKCPWKALVVDFLNSTFEVCDDHIFSQRNTCLQKLVNLLNDEIKDLDRENPARHLRVDPFMVLEGELVAPHFQHLLGNLFEFSRGVDIRVLFKLFCWILNLPIENLREDDVIYGAMLLPQQGAKNLHLGISIITQQGFHPIDPVRLSQSSGCRVVVPSDADEFLPQSAHALLLRRAFLELVVYL
mmetsp:Transcript_28663/g.92444  ORF Transcript_28663/g.92444 Transcript_28663/m.92444 type:complete len:256 (+) Transcript_28663:1022-1789(+)